MTQEANRSRNGKTVRVMFQDEARFGRISDPRNCWAPAGIRPNVPLQTVREYIYAFTAVSPHDGVMDSLILPEVNTEAMSIFLAEISSRHPDDLILMFLDGAGWHQARDLEIPENIRLLLLPPYCPQCNPSEHIWDEVREKWFANCVFENLDGVENTLFDALVILESDPSRVRSLTGFDWIIDNLLIAI